MLNFETKRRELSSRHTPDGRLTRRSGHAAPSRELRMDQSRWFDPTVGRWLSEDPAEADSNLYRYCGNAPGNAVDPSGEISRQSAVYEQSLADIVFFLTGHGQPDEFRGFVKNDLRIVDDPQFFARNEFTSENLLKVAVAKIALDAGKAEAITLGNRIYTKGFVYAGDRDRPCAISADPKRKDALSDAAVIAHELTHVVQQLSEPLTAADPERSFYGRYAAEYAATLRRGLSQDDAYKNISYEREAYAVQLALSRFLADKNNREHFNALSCSGKLREALDSRTASSLKTQLKKLFKEAKAEIEAQFEADLKKAAPPAGKVKPSRIEDPPEWFPERSWLDRLGRLLDSDSAP